MGCDIHSYAERRKDKTKKWEIVKDHFTLDDFDKDWYKKEKGDCPFDWRNYGMFGFFADVRNYSRCETLSELKGIPDNATIEVKKEYEDWDSDAHSASFLTLKELLDFDYDKEFWNRRIMRNGNGAALAEEGEGEMVTYRDFLGNSYFQHLKELKQLGSLDNVRIVFWFDN